MTFAEMLDAPLDFCPCCGKEWPHGRPRTTWRQWFDALAQARAEYGAGVTTDAVQLEGMILRASDIIRGAGEGVPF
jgi:hypothetical protein